MTCLGEQEICAIFIKRLLDNSWEFANLIMCTWNLTGGAVLAYFGWEWLPPMEVKVMFCYVRFSEQNNVNSWCGCMISNLEVGQVSTFLAPMCLFTPEVFFVMSGTIWIRDSKMHPLVILFYYCVFTLHFFTDVHVDNKCKLISF